VKIAVVILNYNGKTWLEKFLPSVIEHSDLAEIVVIDNASIDESVHFLSINYPKVKVVLNKENYGFAGGYNEGLEHVKSDVFVLLNSDIEVTENWLQPIVGFLLENPECAGAQPKILSHNQKTHFEHAGAAGGFIDKYGYPFCRGRVFDTVEEDKGQYDTNVEVFWATGACLFIRSEVFRKVGGFDASYFAHMEEIDLCWRIKQLGFSFYCIPQSKVYHVGGGTLSYMSPHKTFLNFRNSLFTLHKNCRENLFFFIFVRITLDGIAGIKFLLEGNFKHTISIIQSHFSYYLKLPELNKKRKAIIKSTNSISGKLNKSIVWQYFIKNKKEYSQLLK
jgi:GT2 family glycosyltransferase